MSFEISLLLDGQLNAQEAKPVLDKASADSVLRDRYTVYGLVGDVLRGNSTPDDGFSKRIFERMQREGVKTEKGFDPLASE